MSTSSPRSPQRFPHLANPARALAAIFLFAASSLVHAQTSGLTLKQHFQNPPQEAKPMVRWWWFGTAVEKPEILRELQQMRADGIGGAELAFVYAQVLDDPAKEIVNQPFLSPAMLDSVHYAQAEGRKLGLRIDVTLGSGWPYGGPATTLDEAAGHLRIAEIPLTPTATTLPNIKLATGESILSISLVNGTPKHWDAASATTLSLPHSGTSTWENSPIPADTQPRVALVFIASHTHQVVKRAAVGAEGWVLDPFSHQAVAHHLQAVGAPLVKAFGATPPYAIFSDSLEAYGADWTPNLPAEFRQRRGYDLLPHLPELAAGGTPSAQAVRHDWGRTLTELVDENYLTQINNWAIAHHTKFRSQTYGEPAVSLASQRLVALPEGEGPQWRQFSTLRWATSANHLFGNNVTSGETFTWLHTPVFRATPLDMKAEADVDFLTGENLLIFHGWPYSPPASQLQPGDPGWSLYAAAVFNDHNPWHPVMPEVTRYIQRVSFLLRQGQPANQVAVLLPTDDAWANFTPGKVTVTGEMAHLITPRLVSTILSAGYNLDFIDADTINRLGLHHQILVLPPTDRIPVETLRKIHAFTQAGGKVIAVGHTPTLDPDSKPSTEIAELTHSIPVVPDEALLGQALNDLGTPDLQLTNTDSATKDVIGFIRRRLPTSDIYFVANTSNHPVHATASFTSTHHHGEELDPDSTDSLALTNTTTGFNLDLAPYESRVFLFTDSSLNVTPRPATTTTQLADLSADWQVNFSATGKSESQPTLADWTANPDTRFYSGEAVYSRDFTFAAPPRSKVFLKIDGGQPLTRPGTELTVDPNTTRPAGAPLPNPLRTGTGPGMRAWYDPPIHEAAIVYLNGQRVGALWHPPYRLDLSPFLKTGQNHIEIHVFNTAINAWAALPPRDYKPLIAKYGDRFQMQDLNLVHPVPSGILGTIHLITDQVPQQQVP